MFLLALWSRCHRPDPHLHDAERGGNSTGGCKELPGSQLTRGAVDHVMQSRVHPPLFWVGFSACRSIKPSVSSVSSEFASSLLAEMLSSPAMSRLNLVAADRGLARYAPTFWLLWLYEPGFL